MTCLKAYLSLEQMIDALDVRFDRVIEHLQDAMDQLFVHLDQADCAFLDARGTLEQPPIEAGVAG